MFSVGAAVQSGMLVPPWTPYAKGRPRDPAVNRDAAL